MQVTGETPFGKQEINFPSTDANGNPYTPSKAVLSIARDYCRIK